MAQEFQEELLQFLDDVSKGKDVLDSEAVCVYVCILKEKPRLEKNRNQ